MKNLAEEKEVTKMPLKFGEIMTVNGDAMRRIDEADGMVVAFVSDQNLIDGSKRDEIAGKVVRAINEHETLVGLLKEVINPMAEWEVPAPDPEAYEKWRNDWISRVHAILRTDLILSAGERYFEDKQPYPDMP